MSAPEGMVPLEEFAERKKLKPEVVVKMVKDGFFVGRLVDGEWYVEASELSSRAGSTAPSVQGPANRVPTHYGTAKGVSTFLAFVGWLLFAAGIIAALIGFNSFNGPYGMVDITTILMTLPGLGFAFSGLLMVASAQVVKATVENADNTREILVLLQEQRNQ